MSINKPQKAPSESITNDQLTYLHYPVVGSAKVDGWRCIVDEIPRTSSLKPWPNLFVREVLSNPIYNHLDGEILVGAPNDPHAFENTDGPVKRHDGQPNFRIFVFDNWYLGDQTYKERWLDRPIPEGDRIVVLEQRLLSSPEEVIAYEQEMLDAGYEGSMIRSLEGRYKSGRCSFHEGNIFKRKPFVECEAVIVGFTEGKTNMNESKLNEAGQMRRGFSQANMIPSGTLGSFVLQCDLWVKTFTAGLGEGFTKDFGQAVWNDRENYLGKIATVKYQKYGSRDAPRIANVTKIRSPLDL